MKKLLLLSLCSVPLDFSFQVANASDEKPLELNKFIQKIVEEIKDRPPLNIKYELKPLELKPLDIKYQLPKNLILTPLDFEKMALERFPLNEREKILKLTDLFFEGIKESKDKEPVIEAIGSLEANQRESVVKFALPLCNQNMDEEDIADIIKTVGLLEANQRESIMTIATPLCIGLEDGKDIISLIRSVAILKPEDRQKVNESLLSYEDKKLDTEDRTKLIKTIDDFDSEVRNKVAELTKPLCEMLEDKKEKRELIDVIRTLCSEERDLVVKLSMDWSKELSTKELKEGELLSVVKKIMEIKAEERESVVKLANLIFQEFKGTGKTYILSLISKLSLQERKNVVDLVLPFCKKAKKAHEIGSMIKTIGDLKPDERDSILNLAQLFFEKAENTYQIRGIIKAIEGLKSDEREGTVKQVLPLIGKAQNSSEIENLIKTYSSSKVDERDGILKMDSCVNELDCKEPLDKTSVETSYATLYPFLVNLEVKSLELKPLDIKYEQPDEEERLQSELKKVNDNVFKKAKVSGEIKLIAQQEGGFTKFLHKSSREQVLNTEKKIETNKISEKSYKDWKHTQSLANLILDMQKLNLPYDEKKSLAENIEAFFIASKKAEIIKQDSYEVIWSDLIKEITSITPEKFVSEIGSICPKFHPKLTASQRYSENQSKISSILNGILFKLGCVDTKDKLEKFLNEVREETSVICQLLEKISHESEKVVKDLSNLADKIISEEKKHDDRYVFYHGMTEEGGFFLDIMNAFRHQLTISGREDLMALRSFDDVFETISSTQKFLEHAYKNKKNSDALLDHSLWYKARGMATSPYLFGSYHLSHESSWYFFINAGNVSPPILENQLFDLFSNLSFKGVKNLTEKYISFFKGINKTHIRNGRLLQIFVSEKVVDNIIYMSQGGGVPCGLSLENGQTSKPSKIIPMICQDHPQFVKVSTCSSNLMQARLFLKPETMFNPKDVQVIDYMSHPESYPEDYKLKIKEMVHADIIDWLNSFHNEKAIERIPPLLQLKKQMKKPELVQKDGPISPPK